MSDWLYKFAIYGGYLPILIALFRNKYLNKTLWWFVIGGVCAIVCSLISVKLSEKGINNHFMIYLNASLLFVFRTLFFFSFFEAKNYRKALIFCLIIYLSGIGIDIFLHGIYMNQYLFGVFNVWITIVCLLALNQIIKEENIESLRDYPYFWIIVGTLIFAVFDFLLTVLNGWLYAINRAFVFLLWDYITPIFMFIRTILVSIGLWKTKNYVENLVKT